LFNWGISLAQAPVNGTISVEVMKHLEINVNEPNQFFSYNEADPEGLPPTIELSNGNITIGANVNWKFSVITSNNATVLTNKERPSATIDANKFNYVAVGNVTSGTTYQPLGPTCSTPISGSKNLVFKLVWKVNPKFSANYYAGDYTVDINYQLAEQ
jgi:hypothetical protein